MGKARKKLVVVETVLFEIVVVVAVVAVVEFEVHYFLGGEGGLGSPCGIFDWLGFFLFDHCRSKFFTLLFNKGREIPSQCPCP